MRSVKEELINALVTELVDLYPDIADLHEMQNTIALVLEKYEVSTMTTEVTIYHGQINENLLKKFLICKKVQGLTPKSLRLYQSTLEFVTRRINKPFTEVNTDDIRVYLAFREMRDHVSATQRDNERRVLSSFYTWMRKEGIRYDNPIETIGPIKRPKTKKKAFTEMEIERLRIAAESPRDKMILEVLLSTGCRAAELSQVLLSEVDGDTVLVHGKGQKDRYVFLNAKAQIAIENYMNWRQKYYKEDLNPHLLRPLLNGDKHRFAEVTVNGIEIAIRNLGRRAEVPNVHPHRFRRTCATWALKRGMPVEQVSLMLGHEKIETTQIYLDIDEDNLKTAHKKYVV